MASDNGDKARLTRIRAARAKRVAENIALKKKIAKKKASKKAATKRRSASGSIKGGTRASKMKRALS